MKVFTTYISVKAISNIKKAMAATERLKLRTNHPQYLREISRIINSLDELASSISTIARHVEQGESND